MTGEDFAEGTIGILDLMVKCGLAPSKKEGRRLVEQGGVEVNGEKMTDPTTRYDSSAFADNGIILKKGKKVFHRAMTK